MDTHKNMDMAKSIKDSIRESVAAVKENVHEHPLLYGALGAGIALAGGIAFRGKLAEIKSAWKAMVDDAVLPENRALLDELHAAGRSVGAGPFKKTEMARGDFPSLAELGRKAPDSLPRVRPLVDPHASMAGVYDPVTGASRASVARGMEPIQGSEHVVPGAVPAGVVRSYIRLAPDTALERYDLEWDFLKHLADARKQ